MLRPWLKLLEEERGALERLLRSQVLLGITEEGRSRVGLPPHRPLPAPAGRVPARRGTDRGPPTHTCSSPWISCPGAHAVTLGKEEPHLDNSPPCARAPEPGTRRGAQSAAWLLWQRRGVRRQPPSVCAFLRVGTRAGCAGAARAGRSGPAAHSDPACGPGFGRLPHSDGAPSRSWGAPPPWGHLQASPLLCPLDHTGVPFLATPFAFSSIAFSSLRSKKYFLTCSSRTRELPSSYLEAFSCN